MKNRKCSFKITTEVEGNRTDAQAIGITLSDAYEKETKKGKFMFVLCEDESTGEVHEVFAREVKFAK